MTDRFDFNITEYGTYGPWSKWEMEKVNNVNRLKRTRVCTSKECSGKLTETKDCTPALCKRKYMRYRYS